MSSTFPFSFGHRFSSNRLDKDDLGLFLSSFFLMFDRLKHGLSNGILSNKQICEYNAYEEVDKSVILKHLRCDF
jgi:hypothetical protein